MSTVVDVQRVGQNAYREKRVLCKGAPEVIKTLLAEVPNSFDQVYLKYSSKGYRVLALAYKKVEEISMGLPRKQAESGLTFIGFIVFE